MINESNVFITGSHPSHVGEKGALLRVAVADGGGFIVVTGFVWAGFCSATAALYKIKTELYY